MNKQKTSKDIKDVSDKLWRSCIAMNDIWNESGGEIMDPEDWLVDLHQPVMAVIRRLDRIRNNMEADDE